MVIDERKKDYTFLKDFLVFGRGEKLGRKLVTFPFFFCIFVVSLIKISELVCKCNVLEKKVF